jgi:hypothetical protein
MPLQLYPVKASAVVAATETRHPGRPLELGSTTTEHETRREIRRQSQQILKRPKALVHLPTAG